LRRYIISVIIILIGIGLILDVLIFQAKSIIPGWGESIITPFQYVELIGAILLIALGFLLYRKVKA